MESTLRLYNTLSRQKEVFEPLNPPEVGMYTCGPTVYDYAHIGNLRAYVFADVLKRVLEYNGFAVTHIMNITDVGHLTSDADSGEDKMEKGAKREGKTVREIAEYYTDEFKKDISDLNITPPTKWVKATNHIEEQIELIKILEEQGYTYQTDDGVYFDTSKFSDYGKMARLDLENLQKGARVEFNQQKRNTADFALWKFSPKDEQRAMEWESPWGTGFPGWHIECSAMSMKYLGETFDIHTGGVDHIPVHHTNEIAQSEAATGKPFVKYWLHNEFVVLDTGEKMAKSGQNFLRLKSIIQKGFDPLDYRFLTLNAHYRSHMTFSWPAMEAAKEGRERINQFARRIYSVLDQSADKSNEKYLAKINNEFFKAINDDLNTPAALGYLFDLIKDINSQLSNNTLAVSPASIWGFLMEADKILGLDLENTAQAARDIPVEVKELLARRQLARENRDYEASDRLRDQIKELGFIVEDTDQGQRVHPV